MSVKKRKGLKKKKIHCKTKIKTQKKTIKSGRRSFILPTADFPFLFCASKE